MKNFILKTHGCKSNQLESAVIKEKLINAGFKPVKSLEEAQYFILNSCSVTETADNEALRTIRHAKNKNPIITTILTGCSAQLNAQKLLELPFVDIVLGNNDKFDIIKALKDNQSKITDIFEIKDFNHQILHDYSNTRGYLKIQDGCNNYCSYCTIPFARGRSRSSSISNITEQINSYIKIDIKEVVLTGIHIGQWGEDFIPRKKFYDLLEEIEKTQIQRYRLGSLNPLEIDDELIDFLSQSEKFCPHFHLSLQSLNDKTLKSMNRLYSAQSCLELIEKIDEKFKLPFIGSDIITGFPDETDEDFNTTMENTIKSKLSNIHVFPYSVRKNTKASMMKNQIPEKTKQLRADLMQKTAAQKYMLFKEKNVNTVSEVLIEKRPDKKSNKLKGVTKNYLNVLIDSEENNLFNQIRKVKILNTEKDSNTLIAELL